MSYLYSPRSHNNNHYNNKRAPYKVLGTAFNPYQPKISNQVIQEQFNQTLRTNLTRGKIPQKNQYENSFDNKLNKRSNSSSSLISNSYNIINNNPYSRSLNYKTYEKGYSHNKDHVKELLNINGRNTISFYKSNKNKQKYPKHDKTKNVNSFNNNKRVLNNYEINKNDNNELNFYKNNAQYNFIYDYNNKKINYNENYNNYNINDNYSEEIISNDLLEEYFKENCGKFIKNFAYKEKQNAQFRDYMEDKGKSILNFDSNPNNALFCLFDGHGGDEVSKLLQDCFPKYMKEILPLNIDNAENKFKNLFLKIDNKIKEKRNNYNQIGSTACIAYITEEGGKNILYCANVGDTRCILIKEFGNKRLSYDDRASDENEYNRIKNQGGIVFDGRVYGQLMLSRAFGDWELKNYGVICEPHITRINLENDDKYIIMATDGVWDVLEDDDVYELSKFDSNNSLDLCRKIIQTSLDKGGMDNISCFVIALK